MADSNEPKKETVRIALPPQPAGKPGDVGTEAPDTARIHLPARPPLASRPSAEGPSTSSPPGASRPLPPQTQPSSRAVAASAPSSIPAGPKKETARIAILPDPLPKPSSSVQMKKTQPLRTMPEVAPPSAPLNIAPAKPVAIADAIPKSLCWSLLGVSAVILIIQIWTYFS
jgi:hypothetical protein